MSGPEPDAHPIIGSPDDRRTGRHRASSHVPTEWFWGLLADERPRIRSPAPNRELTTGTDRPAPSGSGCWATRRWCNGNKKTHCFNGRGVLTARGRNSAASKPTSILRIRHGRLEGDESSQPSRSVAASRHTKSLSSHDPSLAITNQSHRWASLNLRLEHRENNTKEL